MHLEKYLKLFQPSLGEFVKEEVDVLIVDDVVLVINISHDDRDGPIAVISKITACSSICCTLVQL